MRPRSREARARERKSSEESRSERESETSGANDSEVARFVAKRSGEDESTQTKRQG